MLMRILSALILIPFVLALVWFAPPIAFSVILAMLCLGTFWEFLRLAPSLFQERGSQASLWLAAIPGFLACISGHSELRAAAIALYLTLVSILAVLRAREVREVITRVVWPSVGFVYIFGLFGYAADIRFSVVAGSQGAFLLLFFLAIQWIGDSMAYFSGRLFGRHHLAPLISPKKTVEGTVGGLLGSAATGVAAAFLVFHGHSPLLFAAIALLTGAVGQVGDLLESLFKRAAGVKDSSALIPGHGGLLDRVDSLLLSAPLFYACTRWILS